MLNAQFRPLDKWPGKRTATHETSQFRSKYNDTLDLLETELQKLRAKDVIIQVDELTLPDIRNDGWPRSSWSPRSLCGVIVSFTSPKGPLSFPCDKYRDWRDNLRAIAKSLEALRMVDRYGVTRGSEQYQGWARLEAPTGQMTRAQAAEFLQSLGVGNIGDGQLDYVIRSLMAKYHPDSVAEGPAKKHRHEIFVRIGQAKAALEATQ